MRYNPVVRKVPIAVGGGALALVIAIGLVARPRPGQGATDVRVPPPGEVLYEAPPGSKGASAVELRRLEGADPNDPAALARALASARRSIEASRKTGDPRHLGHAEAALAPFVALPDPPADVLVLSATIEQSRHDFDGALRDLDRALAKRPDDAQCLLTRAVVLSVRADYTKAAQSCEAARELVPPVVYETCAGSILGVTGKAKEAIGRIEAALQRPSRVPREVVAWAVSVSAELRARVGDAAGAEAGYKQALDLDPGDPYVIGAYADLLLDAGRPKEAVALLAPHEDNDGLLLRLVLAKTAAADPDAARARAELVGRYDASRLRGDVVHRREESRWALHGAREPRRALELARANWDVQKEPADARALLEAALAARDPRAADPAIAWAEASGVEDVVVRRLVAEAKAAR